VDRHGVAVIDMAVCEVVGRQPHRWAGVESDGQLDGLVVDLDDGCAVAVAQQVAAVLVDAVDVPVAQRQHPVALGKGAAVDGERGRVIQLAGGYPCSPG
jgi:hypothetical protein